QAQLGGVGPHAAQVGRDGIVEDRAAEGRAPREVQPARELRLAHDARRALAEGVARPYLVAVDLVHAEEALAREVHAEPGNDDPGLAVLDAVPAVLEEGEGDEALEPGMLLRVGIEAWRDEGPALRDRDLVAERGVHLEPAGVVLDLGDEQEGLAVEDVHRLAAQAVLALAAAG